MKEKELNPVIYKTTNLVNGKIYVGQDRYNNTKYLGSGILLVPSIKKYGKENFLKEILEYCTLELLNEREVYWIKELDSNNLDVGYNLTSGGKQRYIISEISKQKIRDKRALQDMSHRIGVKRSQVTCDAISNSKVGEIRTQEFKDNLSKYWKGKIFSEETKTKISNALKGRKRLIPAWNKGITMSEEQKIKISNTKRNKL